MEPKVRIGNKTLTQDQLHEERKRNSKRYNASVRYGKDTKYTEFYQSSQWRSKRKRVLMRDKYLCQECLKQGIVNDKRLMVHHIVELKDDWKQRLNTNNLVTVCTACHNQLDHKPRRRPEV